jgi:hypothetical protein
MFDFFKNCEKYAFPKGFYTKKIKYLNSVEFGEIAFTCTVAEIFTILIFSPPCFLLDNWPSS